MNESLADLNQTVGSLSSLAYRYVNVMSLFDTTLRQQRRHGKNITIDLM